MKTLYKLVPVLMFLAICSSIVVQAQDFESIGKALVNELAARQFDQVEPQFDEQMKAALPLSKLPEIWDSILAQTGPFKSIVSTKVTEKQGLHAAFVTCEFERATLDARIFMDAQGQVKGLFFEPASTLPAGRPAPRSGQSRATRSRIRFIERDTTIVSGPWELPGVLTLPNTKTMVPAVVLVQGSGPQDEDESLGPNKPFKDLAYGLASQNIAVLRYVKRTKQYGADSKSDAPFTVKDEVTDDAIAAVALLAKMPEVNKKQIYVLGHSLGGMLAPRIAAADPQVAGIIIMAGTARPLEKVVVEQSQVHCRADRHADPREQETDREG